MSRSISIHPRPQPIRLAILALTLALTALIAPAAANASQSSKVVAKAAQNATLGKTLLTNTKGRTLYSLSAETKGKFICTGACLSTWHPLVVSASVMPKGPVKLGTIERPDGRTQVTFKGRPLYSFNGDAKSGEANGEGIKDVGTWHAASVGKLASPQPQPKPTPTPTPEQPYPY
jgi:predicted lipoprotein with Yx(FWY)xxD motif